MLFNTSNPAHTSVHQKYFAVKSEITIKKKNIYVPVLSFKGACHSESPTQHRGWGQELLKQCLTCLQYVSQSQYHFSFPLPFPLPPFSLASPPSSFSLQSGHNLEMLMWVCRQKVVSGSPQALILLPVKSSTH